MGVSIKSMEAERKLRRVARLREIDARKDRERRLRKVDEIVRRVKTLPILDDRPADEILGSNEDGLFD